MPPLELDDGPTTTAVPSLGPPQAGPAELGRILRARLGDFALPLLAVQSRFSLLVGTAAPEHWGAALASLHGDDPGPWAALCDAGDLMGLPATLAAWGRERVVVGATIPLPEGPCRPASALLALAPDERAYARLCAWLSWRHEDPCGWEAWCLGLGCSEGLDARGLLLAVDGEEWLAPLARCGGELFRRADLEPRRETHEVPAVCLPLLGRLGPHERSAQLVLDAIRERTRHASDGLAQLRRPAADLAALQLLPETYREHGEQLEAGGRLRERAWYRPAPPDARGHPPLQMPAGRWSDPDTALAELAREGLLRRYGQPLPAAARERLDHELAVIAAKGFSSYILTVHDLAHGRRTCGRGSGASSIVCYALGITNVDPIRYRLVFERFLSEERYDPPDIDVDFPWDERDAVLQAAFERHGHEHVAMVATHQTLQRWGAFRATAQAFGHDRAEVGVMRRELHLAERYRRPRAVDPGWQDLLDAAALVEGQPSHCGLHCGGLVITATPIRELVPVHRAARQLDGAPLPTIAWEKDGAEAMGLVKIDLLGNRSLAVVRDCLIDLREQGITIDETRWRPEHDPLARRLIEQGRSIGCFYIESPAMRLLNTKAGSVDFDRLVVHSSIIRPAGNRFIASYLERLHQVRRTGTEDPGWYPHPALKELLSESYGVLSYQEDVMLVARELAGFDVALQNRLRKSLGKADTRERLSELAGRFFAGCEGKLSRKHAEEVWEMICSFSGYSFAKAHSASYAMVSYQCAWLKAHHPAVFLARVIDNEGGFYGRSAYVEEARRSGCRILPPCAVAGDEATRAVAADTLRLGLASIGGLQRRTISAIAEQRALRPFVGISDLYLRCRPGTGELRALLWSGALDRLLQRWTPAQRSWLAARAASLPRPPRPDPAQQVLDFVPRTVADPEPPRCPAMAQELLDRRMLHVLDCLPRCHPIHLATVAGRRWTCEDVHPRNQGRTLELLVTTITLKQVRATQRTGRDGRSLAEPLISAMAFVTLEDETGIAESVWFPEAYRRHGIVMERRPAFWVRGRVAVEYEVAALEVVEAWE